MATHILSRRMRRYGIGDSTNSRSPISSIVTNWAARVVTNGGAAVSTNTLNAVGTFYQGLLDYGLLLLALSAPPHDAIGKVVTLDDRHRGSARVGHSVRQQAVPESLNLLLD